VNEKADDLNIKLAKWLKEQGYPLEMTVARAFRRAGLNIVQSEYYYDPETGKAREIDVFAFMQKRMDSFLGRIGFCVECKLAKDKPWIIFTSLEMQLADPARIVQRAASSLGFVLLRHVCNREDIWELPLFRIPERPGYGLTQAFTDNKDVPFSSVMAAGKAAAALARRFDRYANKDRTCEIAFPVVVISGKLYECYLDKANEIVISEIQSGTLVWRDPVIGMPNTIVHIVTSPEIDTFVREARDSASAILEVCEQEQFALLKNKRE
jgi:hypothetical protein